MKKILACICSLLCLSFTGCQEKIDVSEVPSSSSSEIATTDENGFVTPDEDSAEYDLGTYKVSPGGIKLYNENGSVSDEIMNALEVYFTAFQNRDFDTYKECLFPGYADHMEVYLRNNYEYGLQESFNNQCDNLENMCGGEFTITRLRAVPTGQDNCASFFEVLNESFDADYYSMVKEEADSITDLYFSVMADTNGEESLIISEFEIVFAEKDGKYYTFG